MSTADENGFPASDGEKAALMIRLVNETLHADAMERHSGVMALLRELETEAPGFLARLTADLRMRRKGRALGLRTGAAH